MVENEKKIAYGWAVLIYYFESEYNDKLLHSKNSSIRENHILFVLVL